MVRLVAGDSKFEERWYNRYPAVSCRPVMFSTNSPSDLFTVYETIREMLRCAKVFEERFGIGTVTAPLGDPASLLTLT